MGSVPDRRQGPVVLDELGDRRLVGDPMIHIVLPGIRSPRRR
jgi:hypothetical protein